MIKETWKLEVPGNLTYKLCKKQVNTATSLKMWNRNVFGHYQTQISRLFMEIAEVTIIMLSVILNMQHDKRFKDMV